MPDLQKPHCFIWPQQHTYSARSLARRPTSSKSGSSSHRDSSNARKRSRSRLVSSSGRTRKGKNKKQKNKSESNRQQTKTNKIENMNEREICCKIRRTNGQTIEGTSSSHEFDKQSTHHSAHQRRNKLEKARTIISTQKFTRTHL